MKEKYKKDEKKKTSKKNIKIKKETYFNCLFFVVYIYI